MPLFIKKVAFISTENPKDKLSWSGTCFRMLEAIKNEFDEVVAIGPVKDKNIEFILKIFQFLTLKISGKLYNRVNSILLSRANAIILKSVLKKENFDLIFAPVSSNLIAYLKTDVPVFYYADSTVNLTINYYDHLSNLAGFSIKESNLIERRAITNSTALICSSDWAARDAIKTYKADPEKVYVVKMGANIDKAPDIINIEEKINQKICNLLFIGVDWKRKGGDIAFKTFELLLSMGLDTRFVVCGCIPPVEHPNMKVYPFLDKNVSRDYNMFTKLLEEAHFLILPTRAECAGIVFCEASSYGIPSVTSDTGGVSSYVKNNVNGFVLPYTAKPPEYADVIINTFNNKDMYLQMSKQARDTYFKELNWSSWAKKVKEISCIYKV